MPVLATVLGHPRIGITRELKRALEGYWSGAVSAESLQGTASELRRRHWQVMKSAGLDQVPGNDFSLYDHMLDMAVAVGAVPDRFSGLKDPLNRYFAMARGLQDRNAGIDVAPLEMTKWFDTNYHYIVPELRVDQRFVLNASKISAELLEARSLGIETRPVVPGPVTFLKLSKFGSGTPDGADPLDLLDRLLPVYLELLELLAGQGVRWVQLDEPWLCFDLDQRTEGAYRAALARLAAARNRPALLVATYFGSVAENLPLVTESGCEALHVDLVRAPQDLDTLLAAAVTTDFRLSLGVVDGRNIWRTDLDQAHARIRRALEVLGAERLWIATSCSLLHVPVDLAAEPDLDPELRNWMAFAAQKIAEVRLLADGAEQQAPQGAGFEEARAALARRRGSSATHDPSVRERTAQASGLARRSTPFAKRAFLQKTRFALPLLPTTTIGSFPQSREVREARAKWRSGAIGTDAYGEFLRGETRRCVKMQEKLGLDVLVHGEFERTDMVEYFGEQLAGFAFTKNGWVQSYGSRCVKPPVLYGDVSRPRPMTVDWSRFAQSLTDRPVKGMLTGPVTILQWSFVRNDQPRSLTCRQIALALRDEVADLEKAGIAMIQVDEPAIREGLPLRRREWGEYLEWAVDAFRLATGGVSDHVQIHTHMCYSEFGDIFQALIDMDADVLSIESSRSGMRLLSHFKQHGYPNDVGPGIYDIHSPRVPGVGEMASLLEVAAGLLPPERLWVNPDCGLKTRGWPEVEASLANIVEAARQVRAKLVSGKPEPV